MPAVEVRNRVLGAPREENLPTITLALLNEKLTVAELIASTVEEQIRDLLINRKLDAAEARMKLNRQYLTEAEAQAQAETGAIRFPSARKVAIPQINTEAEIEKALDAFRRGTFAVFVDGRQVEELDEVLTLGMTSKVTFLRTTPLVGG